jgi:hypothetical protein
MQTTEDERLTTPSGKPLENDRLRELARRVVDHSRELEAEHRRVADASVEVAKRL